MSSKIIIVFAIGLAGLAVMFQSGLPTNVSFVPSSKQSRVAENLTTIGCGQAMTQLSNDGFRDIAATDCVGTQYRFSVVLKSLKYIVVVDAKTGHISSLARQQN